MFMSSSSQGQLFKKIVNFEITFACMWELSAELVVITVEELEGRRTNAVYPFLVCGVSSDGTLPF